MKRRNTRRRRGDVDGTEGYRDLAGHEVTPEYIDRVAAEAQAGYELDKMEVVLVGRPSLDGSRGSSPRVSFRVTDELRERAETEAERRGCTVSQLAREALEQYLAS
jgi:hypothetical protein